MRPEIQANLISLIEQNVAAGFVRGQELFAESVEKDMEKQEIIEQVRLDGVLDYLVQDYTARHSN